MRLPILQRLAFLRTKEVRDAIGVKLGTKQVAWDETVPASFSEKYKLKSWPDLPERYRTSSVFRAISRLEEKQFDFYMFAELTRLTVAEARFLFEHLLKQRWIEEIHQDECSPLNGK